MEEENNKVKVSKVAFKEWLEKLQQESWQLELLISGFALFAVWEARSLITLYDTYVELNRGIDSIFSGFIPTFGLFLLIAWRIFFFNLLIHVLARGLWIGAIGLRYVSGDINFSNFDYAPIFEDFLKKRIGSFDDYIEKLERFSSVLFAYTFLLFFIFLSLIAYFLFFILFIELIGIEGNPGILGLLMVFAFMLGIFAFIDFISVGGIKMIKEKSIARIYYIFYRIFSFLTLSFLYRPILYNFWDEKYTKRLFWISIPYILALTFLPRISSDAMPFFPIQKHGNIYSDNIETMAIASRYYDDERAKINMQNNGFFKANIPIRGISLETPEPTGNYIRFFLRSYPNDTKWLERNKGILPIHKSGIILPFQDKYREDSLVVQLDELKAKDLKENYRSRRAIIKDLKDEKITSLSKGVMTVNDKLELDKTFWDNRRDSIVNYWENKKNQLEESKNQALISGMLEMTELTIDGTSINDSCNCKFYIHPNMGEKGLRCYFPIKHIAEGEHILHLARKRYNTQERDSVRVFNYYVPFFKIN